jgi:hypothetical protein
VHHDVGIGGVHVLAHFRGAEAEQSLDLSVGVVAVQIEMHLVAGADRRLGQLKREVDLLAPEHAEVGVA